ncbi:hypothetical protein SASPL_101883 [Salvia splendens]|uniref:Uncharacterized protein n=1 Tax=Salvia splendens TaxID=180675 RepID=A0A8X9ADN2_SALSN|nr:hypothetical protein SASPL_101883 [Salvia splendens]
MSIQSRSADLLQVEETIRKAMGDLFSRLDESNQRLDESNRRRDQAVRTCDQTLKELRDDFVALKVQNSELMVKLKADNGGNSSTASTGSNTRAQCFPTRQSKHQRPLKFCREKVEITESYVVHLFVSGLNYHVQKSVKMFEPKSLVHAFALARLQESALNFRGIYCENEDRKEDSVRESILTSLEFDEEMSSGKEVCVEKMEGVLIEEARKEWVMKLRGSSNRYVVPQVRNLGNTHTTSMNHSDLEDRGKRGFRTPSTKHELTRELAYKITTGSNEDMCNEKEIAETEQGKENAAAIVVIEHLALTGSLALTEVKGAKMLSEENEKEEEFPPEGSYELMSKTQESKRKQNLGALTITKAMSQREFFQLGHHKYLVSFLIRMKGDEGVCISPWHLSLFIRKGCSLNLSLLGSLPLEESNRFFLPSHHKGDVSSFGLLVWVLLTGKSPYTHNW